MNLWLVPVDEPAFQRTLAKPIDLSDWDDQPDSFPENACVWGVRTDPKQGSWKRNRRNLERMERYDPLLIYRNSESWYTATGRIGPMVTQNTSAISIGAVVRHSTSTPWKTTTTLSM